ncbi:MAG: hypothetical protein CVU39_01620 [Chloroflexi bacterium HGW-Chloroflexi-10]|nr:MAG: hypothetical protein CVU39_01620 [Chloroflexi bacterium HGW-Chloroflexi-10]
MEKNRSQHFNYTYESMPVIFHSQTKSFFTYLERDGLKFLEFWWDHMGARLDEVKLAPFEGVAYEIREVPEKKSKIVLVTLPKPKEDFEAYFMAFVELPVKFFPVRLGNTRVFVLERVPEKISLTGTSLAEVTPRGNFLRYQNGPQVDLEAFYQIVYSKLWKK